MLEQVRPAHLITHRFPLAQAAQAYAMLDQHPEEADYEVILTYDGVVEWLWLVLACHIITPNH